MNIKGIKLALVDITRQLIGSSLSQIPAGNNTTKAAVILNRAAGNKPKFPYAIVDCIGVDSIGYSSLNNYMNEDDEQVDEFSHVGRFTIQVSGSTDDDVQSLIVNLRSKLFTSKGLSLIDSIPNTGLLSIEPATFFPSFMVTDYEEASRIIINFSINDIYTDDTVGTLESIDLDGELYKDFSQDDTPLSINTIAP